MTSLLTSLYLLSFKQAETAHSLDLDCVKFSSKSVCTQGLYADAKNEFIRSRCSDYKQQWGWKKNLKSIDKLFKSYKSIFLSWELNQPLLILFSNGSIVCIEFNNEGNTLKNVEIDNNLCGKLLPSRVVDACICQNYIFVTYSEPKLTVIHVNKESTSFSAKILGKKKGKLIGSDPKISHIDLIGPSSKNLERKLSLNFYKDHLLIWWRFTGTDVWPWTPVSYAADRINMLIYSLNEGIEILCTIKVHGELINAKYSACNSNQILTLVEVKTEKGNSINVSVYEIIKDQCHHASVMQLPLQGKVTSFDWSSTDKLLVSDSNNFLLIYDLKKKTSIVTNLLFTPQLILWHPQDCIALVTSTTGQIQCFDAALTCIKFKLYHRTFVDCNLLELNSHFAQSCSVQNLLWQKSHLNDSADAFVRRPELRYGFFVLSQFTLAGITRNNLSASELISQYLKSDSIDEAILLLKSLNWCHDSELHFQCLSKIANFLLRKPLNLQSQAGLELALGTFYSNIDDLPKRILKLYHHKINHIARRFFHHLLRYHQFRKAYLLAVDLESQDLFLDLFHVAMQKGENALACVAIHNGWIMRVLVPWGGVRLVAHSTSHSIRYDNWEGSIAQQHEKTAFESLSDQQYWSEYPNVKNSWLKSSEIDIHHQSTPFERQHLHNVQLLNSDSYEQNSEHSLSAGVEYCKSGSSFCDKKQVPSFSPRPLPPLPFHYSKSSESYAYSNNSVTSVSSSMKSKNISGHSNNNQLFAVKSTESSWKLPSSSHHDISYNTENGDSIPQGCNLAFHISSQV
ncbi:WD repeat-containing and planar cell polarity [Argiope bruennichi]|uniref:WD repeat-containing and planar cell polarity n=1 Tax=Argiope bruennichi TaxID=94029 RepID=A0A8T0F6L1_ARGBR|nr:WD repeat-containing and planar cell polarity [Argiope bruennichi]